MAKTHYETIFDALQVGLEGAPQAEMVTLQVPPMLPGNIEPSQARGIVSFGNCSYNVVVTPQAAERKED